MGLIQTDDNEGVRVISMLDTTGHNALDEPFCRELEAALRVDETVRVIVLRGLPEVFSRGASASTLTRLTAGSIDPRELLLPRALLGAKVPIIAAMEGHAVGGGLVVGLCADILLLARESRYGVTFMELGFTPGMGATRLLERVMSPAMAQEMLLTGEPKRGTELVGRGFNYVLPRVQVWPRAIELSARLAAKPRVALSMLKRQLMQPWLEAFEAARPSEVEMHEACFAAIREDSSNCDGG